jgi:predicted nucleic acid-binding protein
MANPPLVCDTSLLLYLGRVDQASILPAFFEPVYIPESVTLELSAGRLLQPDIVNPQTLEWVVSVKVTTAELETLPPNRLGLGERSVLAYALAHPGSWVGLDDRQARLLAEQLGLMPIGTVGILIKAKRAGLIQSVRTQLDALQAAGFRLSSDVYNEAIFLGDGPQQDNLTSA